MAAWKGLFNGPDTSSLRRGVPWGNHGGNGQKIFSGAVCPNNFALRRIGNFDSPVEKNYKFLIGFWEKMR
jgi:hypothetical protein